MPIYRNVQKFDFTGKDSLADQMIMHLNVLCQGVEDGVLRKLDVVEVVTLDGTRIRHLHLQILE